MAKHEDKAETEERKPIPGIAPADQAKVRGDQADQRYGPTSEADMPSDTAAPGSMRALMAEEIRRALADAGIGRQPEEQKAQATQKALREPNARLRRLEERQNRAVQYRARADLFVDSMSGYGGLYVRAGESFFSDLKPGSAWEPLDAEGERRVEAMMREKEERARVAAENNVAISALDMAKGTLERVQGAGDRFVGDSERDAQKAGAGR